MSLLCWLIRYVVIHVQKPMTKYNVRIVILPHLLWASSLAALKTVIHSGTLDRWTFVPFLDETVMALLLTPHDNHILFRCERNPNPNTHSHSNVHTYTLTYLQWHLVWHAVATPRKGLPHFYNESIRSNVTWKILLYFIFTDVKMA